MAAVTSQMYLTNPFKIGLYSTLICSKLLNDNCDNWLKHAETLYMQEDSLGFCPNPKNVKAEWMQMEPKQKVLISQA